MSLRINQNVQALNAHRNLGITSSFLSKSMEKLSSGLRINRAADDAAGLAISEKLRGQVKGLNQAVRNSQDGISLIQTAEGALNTTHAVLQRMRQLSVQAANDTNTTADRNAIKTEIDALNLELTRISTNTEFNTKKLLDGTFSSQNLQIGANNGQTIQVSISGVSSTNLGVNAITVDTTANANAAISSIDVALANVSTIRAGLGALQNRLEYTIADLNVASENLAVSENRIRDVDMAEEMVSFTKNQILSQAGTAMLAQANQAPQNVLQLLR
ncbi:MAG: flagellin N-terminal helical domain-containing protein [Thermincolia bacterium]